VEASYGKEQSKRILSYVDAELNNTKRFKHTYLDEDVDLDLNTHFHINTEPGHLEITVDKDENDPETIEKFKRITEGIKIRLSTGEND
jgi:galactose-1-phosphate uridylyltransferase